MKLLKITLVLCFLGSTAFAANIGTVIPVLGSVADLIYDGSRNVVYLANSTGNRVDVYLVADHVVGWVDYAPSDAKGKRRIL